MVNALHRKIPVLPGGRIELTDEALPAGELVEVIILLPSPVETSPRSALDILAEAPGQRLFKTAADVDNYLRQEREAWDR